MKNISFDIDDALAESAESVYRGIGLTTELALRMFLQRTVAIGGLPFDPTAPVHDRATQAPIPRQASEPTQAQPQGADQRAGKPITKQMAERVWEVFSEDRDGSLDIRGAAEVISTETGMNQGSAFIYLVILDNLVAGKPNTRNMKMADLTYYMDRIHDELGEPSFGNACESLRQSIEYWDQPKFGKFAQRVTEYLDAL